MLPKKYVVASIVEVSMNKTALVNNVRVDDWAAELVIIAGNVINWL